MLTQSLPAAITERWPGSRITGPLLLTMWALVLLDYFQFGEFKAAATIAGWAFVLIEMPRLKPKQRPLIVTLGILGLACTLLAWFYGSEETLIDLLDEHLKLAMLLTAISFISMATRPEISTMKRGFKSYLSTLLGMHFFSSVANFSSIPVVGDQLQRKDKLDGLSQSILSRGFSLSVLWSPFLSITPLVLEQVQGAEVKNIFPFALSLAAIGITLTLLEARFRFSEQFNEYQGYPMKPSTLYLPVALIGSVLVLNTIFPQTSTVIIVSIVAVFIPVLLLLLREGLKSAGKKLNGHLFERLSDSRTEICLFLCAGFLAAGVKACIGVGLIGLPFTETNALVASLCLVAILVIASLGLNQLAVVAIFAGLLADVTTTPTIMAVTYIYATALSMYTSVFSGTNMILRVRYHSSSREILRNQLPFTLVMLLVGIAVLFTMEAMGVK